MSSPGSRPSGTSCTRAKKGGAPPPRSFGSGPTTVHIPKGARAPARADRDRDAGQPPAARRGRLARRGSHPPGGPHHLRGVRAPRPGAHELRRGRRVDGPDAAEGPALLGLVHPRRRRPYNYTAPISAKNSEDLVAAFNAGFRMQDANGGYFTQGKTMIPLRVGAASVVIYKDGTMTVGDWGRGLHDEQPDRLGAPKPRPASWTTAKAVAGLTGQNTDQWGKTLGGTFNVWRSGLGVTKNGALVYVGGPALTISDLANVLVRAGAVRGMELDINTDWVQYSTFTGALNTPINGGNGTSLLGAMVEPPSIYFTRGGTATSSRCRCVRRTRRAPRPRRRPRASCARPRCATAAWAGGAARSKT